MRILAASEEANCVPKIIHFIWLGETQIPLRYVWNILNCHSMNGKNYQICLWVNPDYFSAGVEKKMCPRYEFLRKLGVNLVNYHTELVGSKLLEDIDFLHKKRPVIASDLLRLEALHRKGGLYYDVDTFFRKPLPLEIKFLPGKEFIIDETGSPEETSNLCNSFLASSREGKEITFLLNNICRDVHAISAKILAIINEITIIKTTGPLALHAYLVKLSKSSFDYSRLNYAELEGVKSHVFDGVWQDFSHKADAIEKKEILLRRNVLAGVGIMLWAKDRLNSCKLSARLLPSISKDDLANPKNRNRLVIAD
ncbi:MAG TPA: glycosyltransferase [Coxiellaceae bacterium]|nr:glycosyltransferase [Coxiellaceae bacterium]